MFGTDYPTPDGTAVRDYIHIEDLGAAHILGLEHATNPGEHRIYNLGNGTGFSVRQVIEAARARHRPRDPGEGGGPAPGRPSRAGGLVAEGSATSSAGSRRKPEIETMIADAWAWFQAHPEGYGD